MALGKSLTCPGLSSLSRKGLGVLWIRFWEPVLARTGHSGLYPLVLTSLHNTLWAYLSWFSSFLWSMSFLRTSAEHWPPGHCMDTDRAPHVPSRWLGVEQ